MKIDGKNYKIESVFQNMMTVPDCIVVNSNKLGGGHGEKKFYIASKKDMYDFYGGEKFNVKCFMLKEDLIAYMNAIKAEYMKPTFEYKKKIDLPNLWKERFKLIQKQEDIIYFDLKDQYQIAGPRGYVNSDDDGYMLIREIALPLVSYIYSEKLVSGNSYLYYWKLLVDFDAIKDKANGPLVFNYGKGKFNKKEVVNKVKETSKNKEIGYARDGQGKYREQLLAQCHICPITNVSDERILIASHIKPWAASNDVEKIDPYNGYILSPLYDKLFDRGFITFTDDRYMIISQMLSNYTWKLLNIKDRTFIQGLPMDEKRKKYLKFHRESVFKGICT